MMGVDVLMGELAIEWQKKGAVLEGTWSSTRHLIAYLVCIIDVWCSFNEHRDEVQ